MSSDADARMSIASVRILRLALGTALALWVSQAIGGPISFVMPVFTMFILALPLPVLSLKAGISFVLALSLTIYAGLMLLPFLLDMRAVGILLLTLALFWSFYFTARGGSPVIGTFITVGLALVAAVGSVSIDGVLALAKAMTYCALGGITFVWLAHAILPDSMARPLAAPPPAAPPAKGSQIDLIAARHSALRSLMIVLPICIWFLMSSTSTAYVPVMIKVASMGQQATREGAREAGRSLLMSTLIGGIGAIIAWQVLSIWPSLIMYTLLIGLAALVMGPRIFQGQGMHPQGATWSYGFLTMIVILAPAVLDGMSGDHASVRFWDRLIMFAGTTVYGVVAVAVFDAFWPARKERAQPQLG